jgi:serine/threonine-protein kinase
VALDVRGENIDIWMWDFARETLTRLTFDPAQDEYPVWTHDGQGVLFASFRDGAWGVFSQPADGTGTARRVATAVREIDPVSLSPDGRSLVVTGAGNLGVVSLGGGEEVSPLLDMPFVERNGDISPNGRLIAYQSDESGRHEIYVRPFPAVDSGRWQVSGAGGTHPLWARDGGELFFLSPDGLMSAPVRTDSGFDSGTASVVLKDALNRYWLSTVGRPYDVSLDGKRFLMLKDDESSAQVHVVVNWFAELTRLVPAR